MIIEIDQSGKAENTSKNTVIAFSNSKSKSIFISGQEKREVQRIFRNIGKPRIFVLKLFAILIFLLIKDDLKEIEEIIIDEEYPGHDTLIKSYLLQEVRKINPDFSKTSISFKRIGKRSRAHLVAYSVAKNQKKVDLRVTAKQVLRTIIK